MIREKLVGLRRSWRLPDHPETRIQDPIHEVEGVEPRVINRISGQPCVNSSVMDLFGLECSSIRKAAENVCKHEHKTTEINLLPTVRVNIRT